MNRPKEPLIVSRSREVVSEDMEIGDLDLDKTEAAYSNKDPAQIAPQ